MLSMSPDGRQIAFVSGELHSAWKLNVRSIGSLDTRTLAGTEGGFSPFWSPDSRFIGFVTGNGKLKTIDPGGGPAVTLTDGADQGIAWSSQGVILFPRWRHGFVSASGTEDGRLFRISATGGQPAPATELDASRGEIQHAFPAFLPDGRRFIFTALSSDPAQSAVYLASLDSGARTRLIDFASQVQYASGHLLYQRDGTLMAQRFDEKSARLVGGAVRLVENVNTESTGDASFSTSQTGTIVYRTGTAAATLLTWFDAHGNVLGTAGDVGEHRYPGLSPDARCVVFARRDEALAYKLWQLDVARNVASPFTFHPDPDFHPVVWSPDGARVVFGSSRINPGVFDFYQRAVDGGDGEELVYASPHPKIPSAFSPDGTILLFGEDAGAGRNYDIWALPMSGDRKPFPVVRTRFREFAAVFSPDGHWIAYQSNDSGTEQVLVQPFPPTGFTMRLSNTTGYAPQWLGTGDVVYATADQRLMAVAVTTTGGVLRAGTPRELFAHRYSGGRGNTFNVDRGGRRFLLPVQQEQTGDRPISVIVNWPSLLTHK
ncbi:MAG TPA: hypothetical protein VKE51_26485 [Vicinamibacterales bacterium]|nr:hypothetical protein [Vicinamibacterales bacterium]